MSSTGRYRTVQNTFWTDDKVMDEFTPEDKFFYLYLITNPHINISGCYGFSKKQASWETGYTVDTIERLLDRFEKVHQVIAYDKNTKEILIINWHKYNWTSSEKFRQGVIKWIEDIKSDSFREYLQKNYDGIDTVWIPYGEGMDTSVLLSSVTDTVLCSDTVNNIDTVKDNNNINKTNNKNTKKIQKHQFGEYKHVRLTEEEKEKLENELGVEMTEKCIKKLDEYIETSGKTYKNHYLVCKGWVVDAVNEDEQKRISPTTGRVKSKRAQELDDLTDMSFAWAERGDDPE